VYAVIRPNNLHQQPAPKTTRSKHKTRNDSCEIWEVRDEDDVVINEMGGKPDARPGGRVGTKRVLKVHLDAAQYQHDLAAAARDGGNSDKAELYSSFNLLVRRKPKENNFKAVLETIRDLMNVDAVRACVGRAGIWREVWWVRWCRFWGTRRTAPSVLVFHRACAALASSSLLLLV
jgi:hypothetical protein